MDSKISGEALEQPLVTTDPSEHSSIGVAGSVQEENESVDSQESHRNSSVLKKSSMPNSKSSLQNSVKLNQEVSSVLKTRDSTTEAENNAAGISSKKTSLLVKEDTSEYAKKSLYSETKVVDGTVKNESILEQHNAEENNRSRRPSSKKQSKSSPPEVPLPQVADTVKDSDHTRRRSSVKNKGADASVTGETSTMSIASSVAANKSIDTGRSVTDLAVGDRENDVWQELNQGIAEWKRKRIRILNEWKATRRQLLRDWKDVKSKAFLQKLDNEWKGELKKQGETLQKEKEKLVSEWETMKANFQAFDETRVKAKQEELFVLWTQDRIQILKDWESHKVDALKVWNYLRQERARLTEEHWEKFKQNVMADFERSLERSMMKWEKEKQSRENAEKEKFEGLEDKRKEEWEEAKTRAIADWEMRKREALEESGKDRADALEREALNDWARLKANILKSWQEEMSAVFKDFEQKKELALEHFKQDFPDAIALEKEYRKQQRGGGQMDPESLDNIKMAATKPNPNNAELYKNIVPPSMLNASSKRNSAKAAFNEAKNDPKNMDDISNDKNQANSSFNAHSALQKRSIKTAEPTDVGLQALDYDRNVTKLDTEFSSVSSS